MKPYPAGRSHGAVASHRQSIGDSSANTPPLETNAAALPRESQNSPGFGVLLAPRESKHEVGLASLERIDSRVTDFRGFRLPNYFVNSELNSNPIDSD